MTELTVPELECVVGGIRGMKQPNEKPIGTDSRSRPLQESGQGAPDASRPQPLPNISPAPPPPRISAQG
ncbi:MAG TPA: hypothetical protein VH143_24600 [Kofleriaceae bacterium]|jgi:hypothetical protein|nr:hypothetical protein [Kofleriaceae bacterium]